MLLACLLRCVAMQCNGFTKLPSHVNYNNNDNKLEIIGIVIDQHNTPQHPTLQCNTTQHTTHTSSLKDTTQHNTTQHVQYVPLSCRLVLCVASITSPRGFSSCQRFCGGCCLGSLMVVEI